MKILINFFFIVISFKVFAIEIIRDPIAEEYFNDLSNGENEFNSFLITDEKPNAFVIENNIYFTTELIELIEDEDVLKSIFFHELGHIINNHYASKKINYLDTQKSNSLNNILSLGIAVISGNPSIGIASSLAINQKLLGDLSYNSIKFEIEADDYMIQKIKEKKLNTKGLINFIDNLPENKNSYFATHPRSDDRINLIKEFSNNKLVINSLEFNWIKAKYGKNSENNDFNNFFKDLEKGKFYEINEPSIPKAYINYELYKSGISKSKNDEILKNLNNQLDNSFLKIEYFNYIIDNNLSNFYELIEKNKENKKLKKEYYYHFIYGKYYALQNNINLSNFYFCQFYKSTNQNQKIDYYCNNYDKNKISNQDNLNAILN
ncbi:M48 family metalloprotease [Alphaproteobacteria bacterium]|nr:M48 family metalloprotease [Alphaproteobacteria bacterium]